MLVDLVAFKSWLKPQLTRSSYRVYVSMLEQWSLFLNGRQPTKETAEEFLSCRGQQGISDSLMLSYTVVMRKYFGWRGIPVTFTLPEILSAKARREKYSREFLRKNYIGQEVNGRIVRVRVQGKRARPEGCELCGLACRTLYHHWDDKDYSKGLWLCLRCHAVGEAADAGILSTKYLSLKQAIDEKASAVKLRDRALQLKSKLDGNHNEL